MRKDKIAMVKCFKRMSLLKPAKLEWESIKSFRSGCSLSHCEKRPYHVNSSCWLRTARFLSRYGFSPFRQSKLESYFLSQLMLWIIPNLSRMALMFSILIGTVRVKNAVQNARPFVASSTRFPRFLRHGLKSLQHYMASFFPCRCGERSLSHKIPQMFLISRNYFAKLKRITKKRKRLRPQAGRKSARPVFMPSNSMANCSWAFMVPVTIFIANIGSSCMTHLDTNGTSRLSRRNNSFFLPLR